MIGRKEQELLSKVFSISGQTLDTEEVLSERKKKLIEKLQGLVSYLEEKYPGWTFEVSDYNPPAMDTQNDFFRFKVVKAPEGFVLPEGNHHALWSPMTGYKDDFYGVLEAPKRDLAILALLKEKMAENRKRRNSAALLLPVGVLSFYKTLYGAEGCDFPTSNTEIFLGFDKEQKDATEQMDLEELLSSCLPLFREILASRAYAGAYRIYLSPLFEEGMTPEECWKLWKSNRRRIRAAAFVIEEGSK